MYSARRVKIWNVAGLLKVSNILYKCGKDMAVQYGLHHWDNSHVKNWIIVVLCALKNQIYLVYDDKIAIATYQTRKIEQSYLFQKLATAPEFSGGGIGTFCLNQIELQARSVGCIETICEVYAESKHAKAFYQHRGYCVYGETNTLKYKELRLKKQLEG